MWNNLSLQEKADIMKVAVRNGLTALPDIIAKYNEYARGGEITNNRPQDREEIAWMKNWLRQRRDILENNANKTTWGYTKYRPKKNTGDVREAGWKSDRYDNLWNPLVYLKGYTPTENRVNKLIYAQIENAADTPKVNVGEGNSFDYSTRGVYVEPDPWDNSGNYVAFAGQDIAPEVKVHEFTHASHPIQQERYINDVIFKGSTPQVVPSHTKSSMDNAKELYGALQEFRFKNKLKPRQKIDQKYLDSHRNLFKGNYLENIPDAEKLRLFNEVASINIPAPIDNLLSQGGPLREKYASGGDLKDVVLGAAIAADPAVAAASGWERTPSGTVTQDINRPGAEQLRDNLSTLSSAVDIVGPGGLIESLPGIANWIRKGKLVKGLMNQGKQAAKLLTKGSKANPIKLKPVTIKAENATSITPEQWTAAQDAAIARGDMAEAQRLRDLHFQVSAPNTKTDVPLWSSSEEAFNSFDLSHFGETDSGFFGYGHYLTPMEKYAATYHPVNRKFYANIENPYIGSNDHYFNRIQYVKDRLARRKENVMRNLRDGKLTKFSKKLGINENTSLEDAEHLVDKYIADETVKWNDKYVKYADEFEGKDGVLSWRELQGIPNKQEGIYREVVVPRGEQIKLADAVTYDDKGVRIPLGLRDNFNINDIRYALLPTLFGTGTAASLLGNEKAYGGNLFAEGGPLEKELAFQSWRRSLPSNLQQDTPLYDLRRAYESGMTPIQTKDSYHLSSRDPKTGRILKRVDHPAYNLAMLEDMRLGYYPNREGTATDTWEGQDYINNILHRYAKGGSKLETRAKSFKNAGLKMYRRFIDAGIDPYLTIGILGNIGQESSFNPNATNGTHWGYVQNDKGIRADVIRVMGDYSPESQIGYLIKGMKGELKDKQSKGIQARFNRYINASKGIKDPAKLAANWDKYYEISGGQELVNRQYFANYFHNLVKDNITAGEQWDRLVPPRTTPSPFPTTTFQGFSTNTTAPSTVQVTRPQPKIVRSIKGPTISQITAKQLVVPTEVPQEAVKVANAAIGQYRKNSLQDLYNTLETMTNPVGKFITASNPITRFKEAQNATYQRLTEGLLPTILQNTTWK